MRKATLDLNSRGSFVDDLNSKPGIVMCRDALLHRSHEIQPAFFYDSAGKSNFFCFFFLFFPCSGPVRGTRAPPDPAPECHVQVQGRAQSTGPETSRVFLFAIFCLRSARAYNGNSAGGRFNTCGQTILKHTFSAFWLRSSVVSVLISLISGTWRMASHEFK